MPQSYRSLHCTVRKRHFNHNAEPPTISSTFNNKPTPNKRRHNLKPPCLRHSPSKLQPRHRHKRSPRIPPVHLQRTPPQHHPLPRLTSRRPHTYHLLAPSSDAHSHKHINPPTTPHRLTTLLSLSNNDLRLRPAPLVYILNNNIPTTRPFIPRLHENPPHARPLKQSRRETCTADAASCDEFTEHERHGRCRR